jgi:hypothetical protein
MLTADLNTASAETRRFSRAKAITFGSAFFLTAVLLQAEDRVPVATEFWATVVGS